MLLLLAPPRVAQEPRTSAIPRASEWPAANVEIYRERGGQQSARALASTYLDELWHASGTPGSSAAIFRNGELLFSEGIGYADFFRGAAADPRGD